MIESTNLKMLRNLEAFQVFSDILAFLHEEEPVEEPLKGLRDTFAARLSDGHCREGYTIQCVAEK